MRDEGKQKGQFNKEKNKPVKINPPYQKNIIQNIRKRYFFTVCNKTESKIKDKKNIIGNYQPDNPFFYIGNKRFTREDKGFEKK